MRNSFFRITDCFGETLSVAALEHCNELCEIRVRADKPLVLCLLNRMFFLNEDGSLSVEVSRSTVGVSAASLKEIFARLCSYSVYKHIDSLSHGFITAEGGHRIGVCGSAVVRGGEVCSITDVTSLNIRRAAEFAGCSAQIFDAVDFEKGVLICGSPSSGKTTLLRDIARRLSLSEKRKVCVIDERMEIAGCINGHTSFNVGLSDVYSGYPKSTALLLAVRTMSPEFIICDELTGSSAAEISDALNCGVAIIASSHCASPEQAMHSHAVRELISTGAFGTVVFLSGSLPPSVAVISDHRELV